MDVEVAIIGALVEHNRLFLFRALGLGRYLGGGFAGGGFGGVFTGLIERAASDVSQNCEGENSQQQCF